MLVRGRSASDAETCDWRGDPHADRTRLGTIRLRTHGTSGQCSAGRDRPRQHKVDEGVLSAESINKTITRLGQILEVALERELITRNPVRVNPRKRKLKAAKARPVQLDGADQIIALLDAARELDAAPKSRTSGPLRPDRDAPVRRTARRRDRTRARARPRSRSQQARSRAVEDGRRHADHRSPTGLARLLAEYKASHPRTLDDLLFTTARGHRRDKDNINSGS